MEIEREFDELTVNCLPVPVTRQTCGKHFMNSVTIVTSRCFSYVLAHADHRCISSALNHREHAAFTGSCGHPQVLGRVASVPLHRQFSANGTHPPTQRNVDSAAGPVASRWRDGTSPTAHPLLGLALADMTTRTSI